MNEDLIPVLLERANKALEDAQYLHFERRSYEAAISRAYYGMFYAAEAVLLTKNEITASHKGLIVLLGKHFIKEGLIEPQYGKLLTNVFQKRQLGDYEIKYEVSEQESSGTIANAEAFIERMKTYLSNYQ